MPHLILAAASAAVTDVLPSAETGRHARERRAADGRQRINRRYFISVYERNKYIAARCIA
jgi:hypothetical protein